MDTNVGLPCSCYSRHPPAATLVSCLDYLCLPLLRPTHSFFCFATGEMHLDDVCCICWFPCCLPPPLYLSLFHSCNALFMCLQLLLTECQRQQLTAIMFALCASVNCARSDPGRCTMPCWERVEIIDVFIYWYQCVVMLFISELNVHLSTQNTKFTL